MESKGKEVSVEGEKRDLGSSSSSYARSILNEEQLQKLDKFRENVFKVPSPGSTMHKLNDKNKNKKRGANDPPLQRVWLEELSPKQKAWCDDACLCRYLRARDWDLEKAEYMIRCTLAWREDYKPDEITPFEIEPEAKQGKMYFNHEVDKAGRPIIYMKILRDQGNDRVRKLKFLVWMLEEVIKSMDSSKGVEKMTWITDFKGTGMKQASGSHIQISLDCLHTLLNHYPERLGVAYAMNPPRVFSVFWKILTPFMNEVTLNKIKFVSGPKEYHILQDGVDKDVLEKNYGGNKDYDYNHREFRARYRLDVSASISMDMVPIPAGDEEDSEGKFDINEAQQSTEKN